MARKIKVKKQPLNLDSGKYAVYFRHQGIYELPTGSAYIAKPGVDFTCKPESFAGVVRNAAAMKGLKVTVVVFHHTGEVIYSYFQANALLRPNLANYPLTKKMRRQGAR